MPKRRGMSKRRVSRRSRRSRTMKRRIKYRVGRKRTRLGRKRGGGRKRKSRKILYGGLNESGAGQRVHEYLSTSNKRGGLVLGCFKNLYLVKFDDSKNMGEWKHVDELRGWTMPQGGARFQQAEKEYAMAEGTKFIKHGNVKISSAASEAWPTRSSSFLSQTGLSE